MFRGFGFLILSFLLWQPMAASAQNYWEGPVGGTGGNYFQKVIASGERVCGVYVRHAARIDAIQLKICDGTGSAYRSQRFGGSGGSESYFPIYSTEYLSGMVVYVGYRNGGMRIFGLKLLKNRIGSTSLGTEVTSPLYGSTTTSYWSAGGQVYSGTFPEVFRMPGIVGIWGRAQGELDALGLVFSQKQLTDNSNISLHSSVGAQGGLFLNTFDIDGKICRVDVRHGSRIDALRFKDCRPDGTSAYSSWYGGSGGSLSNFTLRSDEYITAIRGSLVTRDGEVTFSSIYFVTNQRTSPVYGEATSRTFRIDIPAGMSPTVLLTKSKHEFSALRVLAD